MVLITCVDKMKGMLFNNRRISSDKNLMKHIYNLIGNKKIWINNFSKELFNNEGNKAICIDDNFINKIKNDEFCFVENISPFSLIQKIDKIVLFNWNRVYPADKFFDIDLESWILDSEIEIIGSSHEKITQQIYIKGENI